MVNNQLIFYGRFPALNEVGGVTTFTYNAAKMLDPKSTLFVDMWDSDMKEIPSGTKSIILNRRSFFGGIRLLGVLLTPHAVHFFNVSSVRSCLFFSLLPRSIGCKWIAIFHHGEQKEEYESVHFFLRPLLRLGLKKFSRIGFISNLQNDFFKKKYNGDLVRLSPYIRNSDYSFNRSETHSSKPSILLSGFPSSIYRIIETLRVLETLNYEGYEFSASVCIYGEANLSEEENLSGVIGSLIDTYHWANLYSHLDSKEFNKIMFKSSLYLRMNSQDSFGLVVAEAIECGLDVIATSVCERYPGAYLISKDDFIGLHEALRHYLDGNGLVEILDLQGSSDKSLELSSFCQI